MVLSVLNMQVTLEQVFVIRVPDSGSWIKGGTIETRVLVASLGQYGHREHPPLGLILCDQFQEI